MKLDCSLSLMFDSDHQPLVFWDLLFLKKQGLMVSSEKSTFVVIFCHWSKRNTSSNSKGSGMYVNVHQSQPNRPTAVIVYAKKSQEKKIANYCLTLLCCGHIKKISLSLKIPL